MRIFERGRKDFFRTRNEFFRRKKRFFKGVKLIFWGEVKRIFLLFEKIKRIF